MTLDTFLHETQAFLGKEFMDISWRRQKSGYNFWLPVLAFETLDLINDHNLLQRYNNGVLSLEKTPDNENMFVVHAQSSHLPFRYTIDDLSVATYQGECKYFEGKPVINCVKQNQSPKDWLRIYLGNPQLIEFD